MSNPRPCVCGHPEADHEVESARPSCGRCWAMLQHCHGYRKKLRTEPLRARRGRTKVTLRPSPDPGQPWSDGVRVWAWADLPDLRETLASGRMTLDAVWKNGGWHLTWPPGVRDRGSTT